MQDLVVLAAKTDPQARAKGVSLLLVDTHLEGFKKGTNFKQDWSSLSRYSELFYDNVKVPKSSCWGRQGQGFAYLMQELPRTYLYCIYSDWRNSWFNWFSYSVCQRAPLLLGQAIGQFQNTRFVLAQAKIDELATVAFYERNVELQVRQIDVGNS